MNQHNRKCQNILECCFGVIDSKGYIFSLRSAIVRAGSFTCVLDSTTASKLEVCKAQQFANYDVLNPIHFQCFKRGGKGGEKPRITRTGIDETDDIRDGLEMKNWPCTLLYL